MSLESSLWKWLKKEWDKVPPDRLHYTRIENSSGSGTPDVEAYWRNGGGQLWLELKVAKRPAAVDGLISIDHLRAKQVEWLNNRWLVEGRAWLLLRVEGGKHKDTVHYLLPGKYARNVLRGCTEKELGKLSVLGPYCNPMDILYRAST